MDLLEELLWGELDRILVLVVVLVTLTVCLAILIHPLHQYQKLPVDK